MKALRFIDETYSITTEYVSYQITIEYKKYAAK